MAGLTITRKDGGLNRGTPSEDSLSALLIFCKDATNTGILDAVVSSNQQAATAITGNTANAAFESDILAMIAEFFDIQPNARLFVRVIIGDHDVSATDFGKSDLREVVNASDGQIRQAGVAFLTDTTPHVDASGSLSNTLIAAWNGYATELANEGKPLSIILAAAIDANTPLASYIDLRQQTADRVSVVTGLRTGDYTETYLIGAVGYALGAVSLANVNESIAWPEKFNIGAAYAPLLVTANGTEYNALTEVDLQALEAKGYIFPRKYTGLSGTFFSGNATANSIESDYAYMNDTRVMDKAFRQLRAALTPKLNSSLNLNNDGTMQAVDIGDFTAVTKRPLEVMQANGEISASDVLIDPAQNVGSTGEVQIQIAVTPVGVAREISVTIGFSIQNNA